AIGRAANRFTRVERNDRVSFYQFLVQDASRADDKANDYPIGGARRSHAEGHRTPSIPNRKRGTASRPLQLVGLWLAMAIDAVGVEDALVRSDKFPRPVDYMHYLGKLPRDCFVTPDDLLYNTGQEFLSEVCVKLTGGSLPHRLT